MIICCLKSAEVWDFRKVVMIKFTIICVDRLYYYKLHLSLWLTFKKQNEIWENFKTKICKRSKKTYQTYNELSIRDGLLLRQVIPLLSILLHWLWLIKITKTFCPNGQGGWRIVVNIILMYHVSLTWNYCELQWKLLYFCSKYSDTGQEIIKYLHCMDNQNWKWWNKRN